ncbi:uncharacterized protein LOC111340292 isoform X2 [Stylophora pistillata]|uniref:uncharacterized protein LOC111340292 isoform X2 n=1 Tax=Stylophora pistillata TaxID=50429 RepID=UPI000C03FDCC|nr:uncharacterized protein LOC111340292 isoform X2 [Stylophora pistillata]
MAGLDGSVLLTGSKLADILRDNPEFIEQLSLCLDRDMRLAPNWKHLASKLEVHVDIIRRLEQYSDFSPTIRLFDFLEISKPDLTIKELKETMLEIGRNDLFSLLTTKGDCTDSKKVVDVITSRSIEAPLPRAGLLDELALALDKKSLVLSNWFTLALKLGVPRKTCWTFERQSNENPTGRLFQYLATSRPQLTLKSLTEALDSIERRDLMNFFKKEKVDDDVLLKDLITPGSEFLERISQDLNRDDNIGVKNCVHLACQFEVPADVRRELSDIKQRRKSPTKEILEWVAARFPEKTLSYVAKALDEIQRNDAIQIISRHFPDAIDSVLQEFECSIRSSLSIPDPKHQSSSRKEKRSSPPTHVAEVQEQSGPFQCLPERIHLVGRSDICDEIISALSSNEAVEIVGPPGYGKTSVVIEVAHRMIGKEKTIAYVKSRGSSCVEDLEGKIIEALGFHPGENTMTEVFRRISSLNKKRLLLIIENIDNLLHLEDQVGNDKSEELKSTNYSTKVCGRYMKNDFLMFFKDLGQRPNVQLLLTSRESYDFSVYFPVKLIDLEPLNDKDSASMFAMCDDSLEEGLIEDLVGVCGGIPLLICVVIAILKRENPQEAARRLSTSSPSSLARELDADFLANEDRIHKCLQICFDRLSQGNQKILVMSSTFPCTFTPEQIQAVFKSSVESDLQTCLNSLKQTDFVRFDRTRCVFSLHPFIKDFCSLKPGHTEAKSTFIRHYSDLAVTLCKTFLSKDWKLAIDCYRFEKDNFREAMAWCIDDHPELHQSVREQCTKAFNKAAVFLAKVMSKQEFQSLFCKLVYLCRFDMHLHSACLTNIGMQIVLSCTCTPHICPRALSKAKEHLTEANDIHSTLTNAKDTTRAQCLSKLGFCYVHEGRVQEGFDYIATALKLRTEEAKEFKKSKDEVMLADCFNDLAASQMVQRRHMLAIQIRLLYVLPVYETNLGDHPFTATTLNSIGNSYHALGDYDNAIKHISKSVEIRRQLLGHRQETAGSLHDLGVAYSAKQDFETALEYLYEAAEIQEEISESDDKLVHTHQAISIALRGLQRNREAEDITPYHVLARGEKAIAAYHRALKDGEIIDRRVKVMLIGQDRAGKTSVGKALKGEKFDPKESSTDGVEMHEVLKNVGVLPWKSSMLTNKSTPYQHKCAELISSDLLTGKNQESMTTPKSRKFPNSSLSLEQAQKPGDKVKDDGRSAVSTRPDTEPDLSVHLQFNSASEPEVWKHETSSAPQEKYDEERQIGPSPNHSSREFERESWKNISGIVYERLQRKDSVSEQGIWPIIWDFAGQAVYRAIHPIFMSSRAIYLLMVDLSKTPFAPAQCQVQEEGHPEASVPAPDCNDTNFDHIMRWMDLVHSLGRSNKFPPVILVGTHVDEVDNPEQKLHDLKCFLYHHSKVFIQHIAATLIVDSTKAEIEEDTRITKLREEVVKNAEELDQTKEKIPLKWLQVEDRVYDEAEKGENYKTRKKFRSDIVDKICQFEMEDDYEHLLNFLHDRGTIVYHVQAEDPDGLIVLDPRWLIDVLCKIVSAKTHQDENMSIFALRQVLQAKGLFHEELLDHAFSAQKLSDIKESLLFTMEKFNLLCKLDSRDDKPAFLVPCMLTKTREEDLIGPEYEGYAPAYITFDTSYVPAGLFCRILVLLGKWAAAKTSCDQQQFFSNAARLIIGECTCLGLVCHKSVIKVHIWSMDSSNPVKSNLTRALCEEAFRFLEKTLTTLKNECHWMHEVSWMFSGKCNRCPGKVNPETKNCFRHEKRGCDNDDCAHYVALKCRPFCCENAKGPDLRLQHTWIQALSSMERNSASTNQTNMSRLEQPAVELLRSELNEEPGPSNKSLVEIMLQSTNYPILKYTELINNNRESVIKIFREALPTQKGVIGPLLSPNMLIQDIPYSARRELTKKLNANDSWKALAERLGFDNTTIQGLDKKRVENPADEVLKSWEVKRHSTVGRLYEILVELECPVIADRL